MEEKRIKKTDALKKLINGVNAYTGEDVIGLDENLKRDLEYILDYLLKKKKNDAMEAKIEADTIEKTENVKTIKSIRRGIIFVDNIKYILHDGRISDSSGMALPDGKALPILYKYYSLMDYDSFNEDQKLEYIKGVKEAKLWDSCINASEKELDREHSYDFIKKVLPIYTSSLREANRPRDVVDFWQANKHKYYDCISAPLCTSVASAYCDIRDYDNARKIINRAYALQGGDIGYASEISLVYMRIKKETE